MKMGRPAGAAVRPGRTSLGLDHAVFAMIAAVAAIMVLGIVNLFGIEAPAAMAAEALVR